MTFIFGFLLTPLKVTCKWTFSKQLSKNNISISNTAKSYLNRFAQTESDWTIGDDILVHSSALRVMNNVPSFLHSFITMNRSRLRR